MKVAELSKELQKLDIDELSYSIGYTSDSEKYVIDSIPNGKWVTYYSEKGLRTGERTFDSEEEACNYFIQTLKRDVGGNSD